MRFKICLSLIGVLAVTASNAQPTISSFTPTSGPIGTTVVISGTNFSPDSASNIVFFGATRAEVSAATATQLSVKVPVGATYQPITVLVNGLIAYSSRPFVVTFEGGGLFFLEEEYETGSTPYSVNIADVNGDGIADVVVANQGSDNISVYENVTVTPGDIILTPGMNFQTGSAPWSLSTGHLDADENIDIAVANYNPSPSSLSVLRNVTSVSETVNFDLKIDYIVGSNPWKISLSDLNNDGKTDMASTVNEDKGVSVFENIHTGASIDFGPKMVFNIGFNPRGLGIADLDNDGFVDLAVTQTNSSSFWILRNSTSVSGSLNFDTKAGFPSESNSRAVAIGDLDNDSKADIVLTNYSSRSVSVFRNTTTSVGMITFDAKTDFETDIFPGFVSMGDLNGDALLDLVVTNFESNSLSVLINESSGQGDINFAPKIEYQTGNNPNSVAIGDLDGDGRPDLVVANSNSNTISVFRNLSTSSEAEITSFFLSEQTVAATIGSGTIDIEVAYGTDVTTLVSSFTLPDGATAALNDIVQVSGVTVNDFSNPVTYTVTAADGTTTQAWTVTVTVAKNTATAITAFSLPTQTSPSTIDTTNHTVDLTVPYGTDVTGLVATFTLSTGATAKVGTTAQASGTTVNDFSQPLIYTITSEDGLQSEEWTVTIANQLFVAGIFEQDYDALVALFNATDGANWTDKAGWLEQGVDVEDWYGITVGDGRVTDISLYGNNLSGVIPEEIGSMSALKTLNLNSNQLTGSIPGEIRNLSALISMDFSANQLSGVIPAEIGGLGVLQTLYLNNNQLTGTIAPEIGGLSSLQYLSLYDNQLTGSIPTEIGNLSTLINLNFSDNQLSGSIPAEIGNLNGLQSLSLSRNHLSGTIPDEIWGLGTLRFLTLSNNQLTGSIPAEIGNLSALINLVFDGNQFSGILPKEIGTLTNLQSLHLQYNEFSGTVPAEIGNLTSLTRLLLQDNNLTGILPSELGNLQNITYLNLSNNPLTGPIPLSLTNLDYLANEFNYFMYVGTDLCEPQIQQWLDWKVGRNITGNDISCTPTDLYAFRLEGMDANIKEASFTISLNLPGADVSALVADFVVAAGASVSVEGMPQVSGTTANDFSQPLTYTITSEDGQQSVDWTVTITNQSIVAGIFEQDYDALVALYNATDGVNWTDKTGWLEEEVDAEYWNGITVNENRVITISLSNNNLSGPIPMEVGNLSALHTIYLNSNQLTGAIPAEIGNLDAMQNLHLYNNQLSGSLPEEIGNLVAITSLLLDNNQLSGNLPIEIGNLTNLQTLGLQYNQMSGPIPVEIGNLSMLSNLNLQSNSLTGTIPQEIENLVNLVSLNLSGNQLSGLIPEEIWTFSGLTHLYLSYNQFSGTIPPEIANLGFLEVLDVSANQFSGTIPAEITNLTNLSRLLLHNNNFTGSLPSQLGNLESLGELWLASNPLTGPLPQSLTNLDNLATGYNSFRFNSTHLCEPQNQEWLDWKVGRNITGNDIVCTPTDLYVFRLEGIDAYIDPVTFTISLNLPGADIGALTAEFEVATGASVSIGEVLQVSGATANDFGQPLTYAITSEDGQESVEWTVNITNQSIVAGIIEQDYNALEALYNATDGANWTNKTGWLEEGVDAKDWYGVEVTQNRVRNISLTGNNLSGAIPEEIGNLSVLQSLYLDNNNLSGVIPAEIGSLAVLQTLQLSYNQLSGAIPAEIGGLQVLLFLNLGSNQLSGTIPGEIGNLSHLTFLSAPSNQLSGAIPAEVGNLSKLRSLFLGLNQLSGAIPKEIGSLSALGHLDLEHNQLSGAIPAEIGDLSVLTSLRLSGNQLSGAIPEQIGSLSDLQSLYLSDNLLSGTIPAEIGNLGAITSLLLNHNQLSGTIPAEIGNLSRLQFFSLHDNQLSGAIPSEIGNLSDLQFLQLFNNQLSGIIPSEIGNLASLTDLLVGNNNLTGSLPSELGNMQNLRSLSLNNNPFIGSIPLSLASLAQLANQGGYFSYSGTHLCEPQAQEWLDWKVGRNITGNDIVCTPTDLYVFRLEGVDANINTANSTISLNLPETDISALFAEFVVFPGASVSIEGVPQVSGTTSNNFSQPLIYTITSEDGQQSVDWLVNITNQPIVAGIFEQDYDALVALYNATDGANWTNKAGWLEEGVDAKDWYGVSVNDNRVVTITLSDNNLAGAIPLEIGDLSALLDLNLYNNELSGHIPLEIGNLSVLQHLSLGVNQLSGTIPVAIGNLTGLQSLGLSNNQLTGAIPVEIGNLSALHSLWLYSNQLSEPIPAEIGNLSALRVLNLASNQLSGPIPAEIGQLGFLLTLWINNNQLSGEIPKEIGNLSALQFLYLSQNHLSGVIPPEIGNLGALQFFYSYYNQLSGPIPVEIGSLNSLQSLDFENNQLSGPIPVEIGALKNLETLWLNDNQLSGSLPTELGELQNLGFLSLYNNPLSGSIPQSFTNLDNLAMGFNSFDYSNTDLCEPQNQQWMDWKAGRNITGNGLICNTEGLLTFSLQGQSSLSIDETLGTISIVVEGGTDLSNLIASFTLGEGANAYVNDQSQVSGTTANDFRQPVTYKIIAEDGITTQNWTVSVFIEQSITFESLPAKIFIEEPFALTATTSSGLPVTYGSSNESVATISGNMVTMKGVGETTITATQGGNNLYLAAAPVSQLLTVKLIQSITFDALPTMTFGEEPFALVASSSSSLAVAFISSNESVATVSGNMVTLIGTGETTITASQQGNANYFAATSVPQVLTVNKASQSITFGALPAKIFGEEAFALTATASSSLAVTYSSSNEQVATISGTTVTIIGAGETTISASQQGNANYFAATSVPQVLTVNKASQSITFGALPAKIFGEEAFALTATASSSLAVTYSSSNEQVATISGNTVTIKGVGETTITASQPGNTNYLAATPVTQSFKVTEVDTRKNQVISFQLPAFLYLDEGPIGLSAQSDSGLPVTYVLESGEASIVDKLLVFNVTGEISITASQEGNEEFRPAQSVTATITIRAFMSISGNVIAQNGEKINGIVQAIKEGNGGGVRAQTSLIDGAFLLTGLKEGDYLIKCIPTASSASHYFPTYYISSFFWQQAQSVTLSNADVRDIELSAVLKNEEPPQQGNGIIKGKVVAADNAGRTRIIVGRIYEGGSPLENIPVYLMKSGEQNIFTEALTDADGVFEMTGLPGGQYELFLDVPGIAMAPGTPTINLDESKPIELTAFVGEEGIVTEVSIVSSVETDEKLQFKVYPNPVSDYLVFDYEENLLENKIMTIRLYNIIGQQLVARKVVAGKTLLDLRGYSPGMLMLAIFDESENLVGQLKIKKE